METSLSKVLTHLKLYSKIISFSNQGIKFSFKIGFDFWTTFVSVYTSCKKLKIIAFKIWFTYKTWELFQDE